ncbi:DNA helicase IV [Pantoea sp. Bo_2]|uniref:DNA helicase IV n=1 Tax=unclassified Pantoea TaxID=2630326 RepID=UPI00123298A7|nr:MULTISPECIES: DNA helicase IV [unclassified Pantoea]KAA5951009.1 DNA helicase IV [Pantoea sp. VH_3]KAA5956356.1 DNA helicase IV [Pantoea sp. VH_25]KAA5959377.1 DNA helicase IV [Pantoea sp. VH_24]KAA5963063.1 DNA helicase IV [Pantoea sp. VH_16]KAA5967387.1 DNA helicase IV [Pantoea sp. VH_18]
MELKATSMGKRLAQHPYNRVRLLTAGVEVSGDKHEYLIPFNQLLDIACKRGLVWGELEFLLADEKVVRLHGTEWQETQRFHHYLMQAWQNWSLEMSAVCREVLQSLRDEIETFSAQDRWLNRHELQALKTKILKQFDALPMPLLRLNDFPDCRNNLAFCQHWLDQGESALRQRNRDWTAAMLTRYQSFFASVESTPLNQSQCEAVVNGEDSLLVLAGAGSGKTSVLVARAGWLMERRLASADQILLLAFGRQAAEEMNARIQSRLSAGDIQAKTFHSLALHIIREGSNKQPVISKLESDADARRTLLLREWRQQCHDKKAMANGWRQWLRDELEWELPEGPFWEDDRLANRLASRLERWLGLMRMHGGAQAAMIADVPEEIRERFSKRIKLMAPLLKAWKSALKEEGAVDFSGLIHQAIAILEKGRFISPWKHILVDEFQDTSPQRAALLSALRQQNKRTALFAVGDDWQAIYRFSGAEMTLTTAFHHYFGEGDRCVLDTTYRFNDRIGDIANRFIQQNPQQLAKPLNSVTKGNKKSISLLAEDQLEALLNKLSGYAKPEERILLLARYHYLRPELLDKARTRWPKLSLEFMTIHASKGQQADYVILLGLQQGKEGFPAEGRESIIEQGLLPQPEAFPDAEERRLAYVALTRARQKVFLMFDKAAPSPFVDHFRELGVPVLRKA